MGEVGKANPLGLHSETWIRGLRSVRSLALSADSLGAGATSAALAGSFRHGRAWARRAERRRWVGRLLS